MGRNVVRRRRLSKTRLSKTRLLRTLEYLSGTVGTIFLGLVISFWFVLTKEVRWYIALLLSILILGVVGGGLKVCTYWMKKRWKEELLPTVIVRPKDNPELLTKKDLRKMFNRRILHQRRPHRENSPDIPDTSIPQEPEDSHVDIGLSQRSAVSTILSQRSTGSTVSSRREESDVEFQPLSSSMASGSTTGSVTGNVTLNTDKRVNSSIWPVPTKVTQGSQVVHMRFEIESQSKEAQQDKLATQICECMTKAQEYDEDFTLQLGSLAVFKSTASGPRMWDIEQNWAPTIVDIHRSWKPLSLLRDECTTWTIRGFNLEGAILRATSANKSEKLDIVMNRQEIGKGLEEIVCKEPALIQKSAPRFQEKIYFLASKSIDLEDGVTCTLHSEPRNVKQPYWISVVDGFTPDIQVVVIMGSLSLASTLVSFLDLRWGSNINMAFLSNTWRPSYTLWLVLLGICSLLVVLFVAVITSVLIRTGDFIFNADRLKKLWTTLIDEIGLLSGSWRKPSDPRASIVPRGITQLNDSVWEFYSPTGKPEMEIIFFHGLQLDHFEDAFWKTWQVRDKEKIVWPKEWLSKTFPNARILSVAYNSCALQTVGQPDDVVVNTLGECLVRDIIMENDNDIGKDCPVFLVGHSLGGIVMKQFVLTAFQNKDLSLGTSNFGRFNTFLENIRGMFYYATPHGDSRIRELASQIQSRSPILELLKIIDRESKTIKGNFRKQRAPRNARGFAVLEGRKTYYRAPNAKFSDAVLEEEGTLMGIDTGFTQAFSGTVVEEGSARENVDRCFTLRTADHFTVCTPQSMNDPIIGQLTGFIANSLVKPQVLAYPQESDLSLANPALPTASSRPRATMGDDEEQKNSTNAGPVFDRVPEAFVTAAPAINRLNDRVWEIPSQPWIEVLCFYGGQPRTFGIDAQMKFQESFRKYLPTARTIVVFCYLERNTRPNMDFLGKNLGADVIRFKIGQNCPVLIVGDQVGFAAIHRLSTLAFEEGKEVFSHNDAGTILRFLENCKNYNDLTLV